MLSKRAMRTGLLAAVFGAGYVRGAIRGEPAELQAAATAPEQAARVFELRTYTANEGKFENLLARFRDHTLRIFEKHGMTNVGYWIPQDEARSQNTLVYLLAHPSRAAADQAWRAFGSDPEWQRVAEESQRDGRLIANLERVYLDPADFSPMR